MAHPWEMLVELTWWYPWSKLPGEVDHLPNIATVCLNYVKQPTKFKQGRKLSIPPGSEQREGLSCFQNVQTSCSKYWHLFASSSLLPMFANWPRIFVSPPTIFPHRTHITSFPSWQLSRHYGVSTAAGTKGKYPLPPRRWGHPFCTLDKPEIKVAQWLIPKQKCQQCHHPNTGPTAPLNHIWSRCHDTIKDIKPSFQMHEPFLGQNDQSPVFVNDFYTLLSYNPPTEPSWLSFCLSNSPWVSHGLLVPSPPLNLSCPQRGIWSHLRALCSHAQLSHSWEASTVLHRNTSSHLNAQQPFSFSSLSVPALHQALLNAELNPLLAHRLSTL